MSNPLSPKPFDRRVNFASRAALLLLLVVGAFALWNRDPARDVVASAIAGDAATGKSTYELSCAVCHGAGVAGAPRLGDHTQWALRVAQGEAPLYEHALKGLQGKTGTMPPKGGNPSLKDVDVKAAVDYMVLKAQ